MGCIPEKITFRWAVEGCDTPLADRSTWPESCLESLFNVQRECLECREAPGSIAGYRASLRSERRES